MAKIRARAYVRIFLLLDEDELFGHIYAIDNPSRQAIERIEDRVRREFEYNFDNQGSFAPWRSLAPPTMRDRARRGYHPARPILERTGSYRTSWVDNNVGASEFRLTPRGWQLSVGSDHWLAHWHERGTRHMPARPVAHLGRTSLMRLDRVIYQWFGENERGIR